MWQFICPELLKAVDSEPELDVKAEHMYAVAQVLMHQVYTFICTGLYLPQFVNVDCKS